jgi:hypothetical protein
MKLKGGYKMKIQIRKTLLNKFNIYFYFDRIEKLEGITSQVEFNKHMVFWDFDNMDKRKVYNSLRDVQDKYDLSDIYVYSDNGISFRAICFKIVTLETLLRIIIDTNGVDMGFIKYTASRSKATIRLSNKEGRDNQSLAFIVPSFHLPIPETMEKVLYSTPIKEI